MLPAVPSEFISSCSKYNSLWLSLPFEFSRACMPFYLSLLVNSTSNDKETLLHFDQLEINTLGTGLWPSCSGVFGTGYVHLYPVVCLATSATRISINGTVFEGICVKPSTLSTIMTTVITITLLWLTTLPMILRRPPIMCCAVGGCIMPRFACCLWPTITHCMNVRFGSEALQLLFCSFFRSGYINCLI